MGFRHYAPAVAVLIALAAPGTAAASDYSPSHVIVRYQSWTTRAERVAAERATGTGRPVAVGGGARRLQIRDGEPVWRTVAQLRAQPGVDYAVPDYRIHSTTAYFPNDPGRGGAGNWRKIQWNFAGQFGVHAPRAWGGLRALHADGGRGVIVAVIDSGIAYTDRGEFKKAPDLRKDGFVPGHDFIDGDGYPLDEDGHGTHVAGTIAETVNNKKSVTGLAYGAKVMPLRVLKADGSGTGSNLVKAITWAVDHGAQVINMSVAFNIDLRAADIPDVISALRYAHQHNVVMVGAAGNDNENHLSYPAQDPDVISVGATTSAGCKAEYSNFGNGLDVMAPGGGNDAALSGSPWDRAHCGHGGDGREIFQQTFVDSFHDFHLVGSEGTSESAPHVAAIAAMIIASHRLGAQPSADAVQARIESRSRDLGPAGYDKHYGFGLVDAAASVAP